MSFQYLSLSFLASPPGVVLLVVGGAGLILVYVSTVLIYNVYIHPLGRYPGPKLWAAFRFPYVYHQLQGRLPILVKELHDKYGPVVRIAPNELSYTTAAAWKDIYGFRPGHSQLPKDLIILPPIPDGEPQDIIHGDDLTHSRYRRLLSHAFSAKALEEQHGMIMSYVNLLVKRLHENAANSQDLVAWYNWTTFDLVGDLAFGESFDCLKDQRYHPWVNTILGGINGGVAISAAQRYGLGGLLISLIPKSITKNFDLMWDYTRDKVHRRLENGADRPDFISHLMRHDKDRKEMSQREMDANALVLVVAGSETTASLLSGATYYLLMNPKVLRRVTEEVRNAYKSEGEIDCTTVHKLDYLTLVLKESLRIYPPAPSNIPRKVVGKGDIIDGKWVPQHVRAYLPFSQDTETNSTTMGSVMAYSQLYNSYLAEDVTTVGVFQWACNHSASNFHEPDSFHPERWLEVPPSEFAADSKDAMQPFSMGPRNCIGKNLAYVEMRIILARMLWNFDFTLEDVSRGWTKQKVYLIWAKHPLMVKLTPAKRG